MFVADLIMMALAVPFIILVVAGYVLISIAVSQSLRESLAQGSAGGAAAAPPLPHARLAHRR